MRRVALCAGVFVLVCCALRITPARAEEPLLGEEGISEVASQAWINAMEKIACDGESPFPGATMAKVTAGVLTLLEKLGITEEEEIGLGSWERTALIGTGCLVSAAGALPETLVTAATTGLVFGAVKGYTGLENEWVQALTSKTSEIARGARTGLTYVLNTRKEMREVKTEEVNPFAPGGPKITFGETEKEVTVGAYQCALLAGGGGVGIPGQEWVEAARGRHYPECPDVLPVYPVYGTQPMVGYRVIFDYGEATQAGWADPTEAVERPIFGEHTEIIGYRSINTQCPSLRSYLEGELEDGPTIGAEELNGPEYPADSHEYPLPECTAYAEGGPSIFDKPFSRAADGFVLFEPVPEEWEPLRRGCPEHAGCTAGDAQAVEPEDERKKCEEVEQCREPPPGIKKKIEEELTISGEIPIVLKHEPHFFDPPGLPEVQFPESEANPCEYFPFGLPCWLYEIYEKTETESEAPHFSYTVDGVSGEVNLEKLTPVMEYIRVALILLATIGFMMFLYRVSQSGDTDDG
jgi:hypothetical protein